MTIWKAFTVAAMLATSPLAHSKGIFQAQGKITELKRNGDEITFRFVGRITFEYATAPAGDPRGQWKALAWDEANVEVRIGEWTLAFKPSERADRPEVERIYLKLSDLESSLIQFSVDNPGLSFSNAGQLARISGTFIYPRSIHGRKARP